MDMKHAVHLMEWVQNVLTRIKIFVFSCMALNLVEIFYSILPHIHTLTPLLSMVASASTVNLIKKSIIKL